MLNKSRAEILQDFKEQVAQGKILVGVGAGTGITAKCSEAADVDMLIIYNSGRFRMAGRGSLSGLLLDCNGGSKEENKQPAVLITGVGGRVSDMKINNPWIGIFTDDKSNPGRCFIDKITLRGCVFACDSVEIAGYQLLAEEK